MNKCGGRLPQFLAVGYSLSLDEYMELCALRDELFFLSKQTMRYGVLAPELAPGCHALAACFGRAANRLDSLTHALQEARIDHLARSAKPLEH